jgi:hypothetical protein
MSELSTLRQKLVEAWSEHPFPADRIARLNVELRAILAKHGLQHVSPIRVGRVLSDEEKARRSARMAAVWAAYRARKELSVGYSR